jgi:MYXO-CTERM domain-containing protein
MHASMGWIDGIAFVLSTISVRLAPVAESSTPSRPTHIVGGDAADNCAWPTTVYLAVSDSLFCSGTLVHPLIVVTAAHCLPQNETALVGFGEDSSSLVELQETEYCLANPDYVMTTEGNDYGFCKLKAPVEGIPIVPIAFGCETSVIALDRSVTVVGFGLDDNDESGTKRVLVEDIVQISQAVGEIVYGNAEHHTAPGDSGGSVFMRLPAADGGDDTWRLVGIHSWGFFETTGVSGGAIAANAVPFIESESGVDITPCHDADGTWAPTGACTGVPLEPGVGGEGSYDRGCPTGSIGGDSAICGAPFSAVPDTDAPSVQVVEPSAGQVFEQNGGSADVVVDAQVDDGEGWGIEQVDLVILPVGDEALTDTRRYPPFRWNTTLPEGGYHLKIVATDYASNASESEWIPIGVGVDAPTEPPDDGTTTTDGGESESSGTEISSGGEEPSDTSAAVDSSGSSADGTPPADGDAGCGCTATPAGAGWLAAFVGVARRRRRVTV